MSASKHSPTRGGVSPLFLLFLTFLVLKLTNVIAWSWWWVTAPLWGGFALALTLFAVGTALVAVADRKGAPKVSDGYRRR